MKTIEGKLIATGLKVGIVASRFNEFITGKLLGGAEDSFVRHGGNADDLEVAWVPGAFEIPLIAQKMAASKKYDAVVCLGAVIRGSTPHFDIRPPMNPSRASPRPACRTASPSSTAF